MWVLLKTPEFERWLIGLTPKQRGQIESRLERIIQSGHFGYSKLLKPHKDGLIELKFNNGLRIYFMRIDHFTLALLFGGHKNGQDKDIKEAKAVFARQFTDDQS